MRTRTRTALLAVATAMTVGAGATAAAAAPQTWLPDASLWCEGTEVATSGWVAVPPSDTLWITDGPLAGHYVIVTDTHYRVDGYVESPPQSYDGLVGVTRERGVKQGLAGTSMTCDFVSRWGEAGADGTYSVIGPITVVRVPG